MNSSFNGREPAVRKDCIDFVIVSNHGTERIKEIFKETAAHPEKWMMHHFIVVYDTDEECRELKKWVRKNRELTPLPKITACLGLPENRRNVSALRQQGLEQGENPYVYFQDDDDPLPTNLHKRIKMMSSSLWLAIYGITQSVGPRGQVIEEFPMLSNDDFAYEPVEATRFFPTYAHPLAALFKRDLFKKVPIADKRRYACSGSHAFSVRLFASNLPINFFPDVIRKIRHHPGNSNGIFEKNEAVQIAKDIDTWSNHIKDEKVKDFQAQIADSLRAGTITTYREIDAHVEEMIEQS